MGVLDHLGKRPDGSGRWSATEAEAVLHRIRAGVDLEQEITLSPDECWVLLRGLVQTQRPRNYRPMPTGNPYE